MAKLLSTQRHCSYRTSDCRRKPDRGCFVFGSRPEDRRGVLLLVCLVLLVMFLMLGVTFVLTAGSFRRSSEAYQRMMERPSADLPERSGDLLDSVARDLVRGTTNPDSPFSKENLLEDLYGQTALRGRIAAGGTANSNAQVTAIAIAPDSDFTLSGIKDYYSGLVMTFLTGDAAGHSARIVSSSGDSLSIVTLPGGVTPSTNDIVLVNGRPFSGDGSGQDDGSGSNATVEPRRLNEDYDAPDINNPWLASKRSGLNPSWNNNFKWGSNTDGRIRPYGKTPMVDNDGDGEKDSIWIDAGLPLQIQPDGSYVRPLVAMLVRDMDGRVNLNAHGSAKQLDELENASSPLGQGYGPAEVDLWQVFDTEEGATFNIGQFMGLRLDESASADQSFYGGGDLQIAQPSPSATTFSPQEFSEYYQIGTPAAVVTPLDPHGQSFYQANATGTIDFQTADGSLANDFDGTTYALEIDTSSGITPDWHTPYGPEDLERVLRFSDADADALDSRLYEDLAACFGNSEIDPDDMKEIRERITTESWDLPVAGLGLPEELHEKIDQKIDGLSLPEEEASQLREYLFGTGHITDLAKAKWYLENPDGSGGKVQSLTDVASLKTAMEQLLLTLPQGGFGPGLTRGTRFNVNRLFGNGQDDNENNVVDDVGEVGTETITAPSYSGNTFNHDGSGAAGEPNDKFARQHYAQQLYLLLMLLADGLESDPAIGSQENLARRIAQFAVNAVDYRDADSIMTGFEYDAFPFDADGWLPEAEGDLSTTPADISNYGVVWGCEAPALAITETLALHDRRTRDKKRDWDGESWQETLDDDGNTVQTPAVNENHDTTTPDPDDALLMSDKDFDQYALPQGSLFIELQRIANHGFAADGSFKGPQDIYDASGDLHLSKRVTRPADAQFRAGEQDPVWRMAVTEPHGPGSGKVSPFDQLVPGDQDWSPSPNENRVFNPAVSFEPDDPFNNLDDIQNENPIERYIFFQSEPSSPEAGKYYNRSGSEIKLKKSDYLTVAPRDETPLGWKTDGTTRNDTVSIPTGPDASDRNRQKMICGVGVPDGWTNSGSSRQHIGLSVSEPLRDNYYEQNSSNADSNDEDKYDTARDRPFDHPSGNQNAGTFTTPIQNLGLLEGTVEDYCTVFLQRLANPLLPHNPLPGKTGNDPALEVNPYLTLDLMPIDLTIFNGDSSSEKSFDVNADDQSDNTQTIYATSRQRGYGSGGRSILWPVADPLSGHNANLIDSTSYFGYAINSGLNTSTSENPGVSPEHVFWPDRPFVSQYELLMVPASEPGKLMLELGSHQGDPGTQFTDGFPHLLNFFYEASASSPRPRLGRIFEYLHVPSKFAGTQLSLSPTSMSGVDGFAPPFNVISTYREPGRVNLNTIEDQRVWDAVMNGTATDVSRHHGTTQLPATTQVEPFHGPGAVEQAGSPLTAAPLPLLDEKLGFEDTSASNDAFLRYQPINRMGNLVTNRSNVYAVWMTLGFFETDPNGDFKTDQDGNLIEDGNEVERHRAFYLIDRSIPVGYENGHDHNTEDVFRVKRYVE